MKKLFAVLSIVFYNQYSSLAQIGIGTESPHQSSVLHLNASDKGLLIPNISLQNNTDTSTIMNPAASLMIFNTSNTNGVTPGFYYWHSGQWNKLSAGTGGSGWSLSGNSITNTDFLGTTNYQNLIFKVNDNQVGKFVPNGGISLGNGANANDNQSIAIGVNANSSSSNQATAIGYNSIASGYQSTALGYNSESTNNSSTAIGYDVTASGLNSTAVGANAAASGQNSTSIGYQANTSQANAIVLGNSSNTNNKVGIGTNTPDERLHIAGKLKIVDGTQSNGYILTSDTNGVASWKSPDDANNVVYAQTYKLSDTNLESYDGIPLGSSGEVHNLTVAGNYIQTQSKTGIYKITYTVSIRKNSGPSISPEFFLTLEGTEIPGSRSFVTVGNGETRTVTVTRLVNIGNTYQLIRLMSNTTDNNTSVLANGTSLLVEFMR